MSSIAAAECVFNVLTKLTTGLLISLFVFGNGHAADDMKPRKGPRFSTFPACASSAVTATCERALTTERAGAIVQSAPAQALNYESHDETIDITLKTSAKAFAFGEAPYLCCDLQTYLKPVSEGLWGVSIDAPKLNAAVLELSIANLLGAPSPHRDFRGPDATHPRVTSERPAVALEHLTINSRHLQAARDIDVYRGRLCQRGLARCQILYLSDGASYAPFLNYVPSPSAQKRLDHLVIVGIDNPKDDDQFGEKRMGELLLAAGDSDKFNAFELFVTDEVIPLVEPTPVSRRARFVGGWSNGGAWALSMALAHSDLFSTALVFSNGIWKPPSHLANLKDLKIKFGGGTLEQSSKKFDAYARQIAQLGPSVDERYVVGGHSISTWNALFWWAIAPPSTERNTRN
jgi:enterochelin esterase-like enzyme